MRVKTVRQVKNQQRPRNKKGNETAQINRIYRPNTSVKQNIPPSYRMPPQPPAIYGESTIPGSAFFDSTSEGNILNSNTLHTHSTKYPVERELIAKNEKSSVKIPFMNDRSALNLLSRQSATIAPDLPPKQLEAWNAQSHQSQPLQETLQANLTGAIPRTPARLPEDVTALAERENNKEREYKDSKSAVSKTYHTLKDLISSRFKKDANETVDELNNVIVQQQNLNEQEDRSPYSALPLHMRQNQDSQLYELQSKRVQQRAASQPQLNIGFDGRTLQPVEPVERRGSLANIDVTDSDEGGFASHPMRQKSALQLQMQDKLQHNYNSIANSSPNPYRNTPNNLQITPIPFGSNYHLQQQYLHQAQTQPQQQTPAYMMPPTPMQIQSHNAYIQQQHIMNQSAAQNRQDMLRASFQKAMDAHNTPNKRQYTNQDTVNQQQQILTNANQGINPSSQRTTPSKEILHLSTATITQGNLPKLPKPEPKPAKLPSSAASSDYDKSGNHSSNIDSGRGSVVYSSGRKGLTTDTSPENSDSVLRPKENDSEWVDIVDSELRNILEPGMKNMSIRPESTVSGSVSSITPPLPPLSPDAGSTKAKPKQSTNSNKLEYGMDSYNRPGKNTSAIGPSRAGWPSSSTQKANLMKSGKKQEQSLLKRHLFGLDNDQTSTTTRSLDLESILGGPWGAAQSVSDSETDTQGLRHIKTQLEGLEHMYSEVLKMLGSRPGPSKFNETSLRSNRRRHGSLSSLPSSSVSSRPIRDRRRSDERRKVRDIKGINKRFQRLESHVVTLARSVAHLSSEMRSQHLMMQELERLRDDLTALRTHAVRNQSYNLQQTDPEPPNLTNPKRVKKLTNFFGEDPPLMRLFLRKLGYEKYADVFETERVGMIELPYLGEERLQKLGVPLGPRLRILQEAQVSLCKDTTLCII